MIKVNAKKNKGNLEDNVTSARHKSTYDTDSINRALERAIKDDKFVSNAIKLLNGIHFPAFKNNIIDYIRSIVTTDKDMISLFESLDGYIKYKDPYHVQKALEENIPAKKKEQQPNLYDLSRQLESHTKQLSTIASIVQQLPKFLKNANTQSRIIKQINS